MQKISLSFDRTTLLPQLISDYLRAKGFMPPLTEQGFSVHDFNGFIEKKKFAYRQILVAEIRRQYEGISLHSALEYNIQKLASEKTFTITTAHQPCVFGGPLYFVYKIISTIKACKTLKSALPEYDFIPVYWMGSEDHDFEEISSIHLFQKTLKWQGEAAGPVGKRKLDAEFERLSDELKQLLGEGSFSEEIRTLIEDSFKPGYNLAEATRLWVNRLFAKHGLIIIDQNNKAFKRIFSPIIREELKLMNSGSLIKPSTDYLETHYKVQAHSREINLFWLKDDSRERIIREGDLYKVNNTSLSFNQAEILDKAELEPECFSPNVILRPLLQEMVLPNLAYIGGPGELSYWLQLKPLFDHYEVAYPLLMLRDSFLQVDEKSMNRFNEAGFKEEDIFLSPDKLAASYALRQGGEVSFGDQIKELSAPWEEIIKKAGSIDPTLVAAAVAERQKSINGITVLEARLLKALKKKHEDRIQQILHIRQKWFPEEVFQERYENFMMYYLRSGEHWLDALIAYGDPFTPELKILIS